MHSVKGHGKGEPQESLDGQDPDLWFRLETAVSVALHEVHWEPLQTGFGGHKNGPNPSETNSLFYFHQQGAGEPWGIPVSLRAIGTSAFAISTMCWPGTLAASPGTKLLIQCMPTLQGVRVCSKRKDGCWMQARPSGQQPWTGWTRPDLSYWVGGTKHTWDPDCGPHLRPGEAAKHQGFMLLRTPFKNECGGRLH